MPGEGFLPPLIAELRVNTKNFGEGMLASREQAKVTTSEVNTSADKMEEHSSGAFTRLGKVAKLAMLGIGGAAIGLGVAVAKSGLDEIKATQTVTAQLTAGLKSTGDAAGTTVDQMTKLGESIQGYSGQTKTSIDSAQALLLTFTSIKNSAGANNDIFNQATKATADMAARMGGDASSKAIQLGKALNDPTKGITALTRVGVSFTAAQKDQIKAMQDSGNIIGAQKIILHELNNEFGGSAKAAGQTLPGELARAKEAFAGMSATLIEKLLPVLQKVIGYVMNDVVPVLTKIYGDVAPKVRAVFVDITDAVKGLIGTFTGNGSDALDHFSGPVANGIITAGSLMRQAFDAIVALWKTNVIPTAREIVNVLRDDVVPVLQKLGGYLMTDVIPAFQALGKFIADHATLFRSLAIAVGAMVLVWESYQAVMLIVRVASEAFAAVQAIVNTVLDANPIGIVVLALAGLAAGLIYAYKHSATFRDIVQGTFKTIKQAAMDMWNNGIKPVFEFLQAGWNLLWSAVSLWWKIEGKPTFDIIVFVVKGLGDGFTAAFGVIKSVIQDVWNFVKPILEAMSKAVGGVVSGVGKVVGVASKVGGAVGGVLKHIPGLATGGIVSKPTLAVIGEAGPEAVVPLSGLGGTPSPLPSNLGRSGGGGDTYVIHMDGTFVGSTQADVARWLYAALVTIAQQQARRNGATGLAGIGV